MNLLWRALSGAMVGFAIAAAVILAINWLMERFA